MNIVVTGATGFIGNHLVGELLGRGHRVVAIARNRPTDGRCGWLDEVEFLAADLYTLPAEAIARLCRADALVHLAWPGLPNYAAAFHIEDVLPREIAFARSLIHGGLPQLLVTGTCFEYGLREGALDERTPTSPVTYYGLAKDSLRRYLEMLAATRPTTIQWARLFYLYGPGQSTHSLLAKLDAAIAANAPAFDMSGGEQLRDYLPVNEVVDRLATLLEHPGHTGTTNVCSGVPVSVRSLVEARLRERGADIRLNLGVHPYPAHEPMAFWGCSDRFRALPGSGRCANR